MKKSPFEKFNSDLLNLIEKHRKGLSSPTFVYALTRAASSMGAFCAPSFDSVREIMEDAIEDSIKEVKENTPV
jgi:hypothetical protein